MKKKHKRYIVMTIVILLIIIIGQLLKIDIINNYKDQGSISLVEDIVNITYTENKAGPFGIGQNDTVTYIAANILVMGIIIKFIVTQRDRIGGVDLSALTLILGGGISNFIDRIIRGYTVAYIDITPLFNFPIFNLEDVVIIIGWLIFVTVVAISMIKLKNEKVEDKIEEDNNK